MKATIDFEALTSPFHPSRVSWRIGSTNKDKTKGLALAYIDARDVYERLDDVCGQANWQCRYESSGSKTWCDIGIKIDGEWVWKSNGCGDTAVEADKGAFSDAIKRAAVTWGIGRYLYDLQSPWVNLVARGRTHVIADDEYTRLNNLLWTPRAYADHVIAMLGKAIDMAALATTYEHEKLNILGLPDDLKTAIVAAKDVRKAELATPPGEQPSGQDAPFVGDSGGA